MSSESELERLLREGRTRLPEPNGDATRRARAHVEGLVSRRRRRRVRIAALVATALFIAVGVGVALGSLVASSGTAASGPIGFGLLPEPGWQALQAAAPSAPGQHQVAMAANVPFAADDVVHGLAEPSALPYSTLLRLPPRGIVIVASLTARDPNQPSQPSARFPHRDLPLHIRDATPYIEYGTQLRPEQPLGQYQLRAVLDRHYLDVYVYFGTPDPGPELLAGAQRQLERLVVRPRTPSRPARARDRAKPAATSASGVIDRTFSCSPSLVGGAYKLDALASRGSGRSGATWERPPFAGILTNISGTAATAVDNYLVWLTAGRPSRNALVPQPWRTALFDFPYRVWGTLVVNRTRCRASTARVALSSRGLVEGQAGVFPERFDCTTPRAVLLRVRAVTEAPTTLRSYRSFVRTQVPATEAVIAVQTPDGKRLAFARLSRSGASRIFVAQPPCYPN